jgi:acyl-[acyl carrier protein]--UDP-N-acetylglucosamine O-acyltransferase
MNLQEQISRIQSMMNTDKNSHMFVRRRFDTDELDNLIKDVKELVEYGTDIESAIYDAAREFIKEKRFSDIDEFGNEESYWKSYLRYEEPLIKYIKEKLGYE